MPMARTEVLATDRAAFQGKRESAWKAMVHLEISLCLRCRSLRGNTIARSVQQDSYDISYGPSSSEMAFLFLRQANHHLSKALLEGCLRVWACSNAAHCLLKMSWRTYMDNFPSLFPLSQSNADNARAPIG